MLLGMKVNIILSAETRRKQLSVKIFILFQIAQKE